MKTTNWFPFILGCLGNGMIISSIHSPTMQMGVGMLCVVILAYLKAILDTITEQKDKK